MAVIMLAFLATRLSAFDLPDSAGWPEWWGNAIDPTVRIQGSEYLRNPQTRAVGELMLARHYESSGQLAKALFHAKNAQEDPSTAPIANSMAAYVVANNLGNMGRLAEQQKAIQRYAAMEETASSSGVGIRRSEMMEFYRLTASGNFQAAKEMLQSFGEPKDTDSYVEFGFARANLAAMEHRDPAIAFAELEKLLPTLQGRKGRNKFRLFTAGAVYADRLFRQDEAKELLTECFADRSQIDYVLLETDLARLCIASCEWNKAAEWLEKAHNAKMTLRPNYRQEAIKDLALATADFYLATGHPDRAITSLQTIEDDFFRPGYTTESIDYFLAGFHLRQFLAYDLQLKLLGAVWRDTATIDKIKFTPSLAGLFWKRTTAQVQFRQNLFNRLRSAPQGVDIAQLYYGPAWLLPAMRHALGEATFKKICTERMPEGRRLEILATLLAGGDSKPIHAETPPILRATILAQRQHSNVISAYQSVPSSLLLSLRPLPIAGTNLDFKPSGWMTMTPDGFQLDASDGTVSVSAGGRLLRSTARPEAKNPGALLEKLSKALLTADFPVTEQTAKKIEGGAVAFENLK
jgi:tetratricopeptide (TPR) repeat protein